MTNPRDELVITNAMLLGGTLEQSQHGAWTMRHRDGWSSGYFFFAIDAAWNFIHHLNYRIDAHGHVFKAERHKQ